MTVTYTIDVSNANLYSFVRTMFRWRGSIWKSVWYELVVWCAAYALLSVMYRCVMGDHSREVFEKVCTFCSKYGDFIPFSFILGYFVTTVVGRWQTQFGVIGWIDKSVLLSSAYIRGTDERARMLRRHFARCIILLQTLLFRSISVRVRKRFPSLDSLVDAGLMLPEERPYFEDMKFWYAIKLGMQYIEIARAEGYIQSDNALHDIYDVVTTMRVGLMSLWLMDWMPVPLAYTQIIFASVRVYFLVMLLSRQYLSPAAGDAKTPIDAYVPFISIFEFISYVGWLKVAECLLNPFGEDDEDFETNWILDRNLQVGLHLADYGVETTPPLEKDIHFDKPEVVPFYSRETFADRPETGPIGSAAALVLPPARMMSVAEMDDMRKNSTFVKRVATAFKTFRTRNVSVVEPSHPPPETASLKRGTSLPDQVSLSVAAHSTQTPSRKWSVGSVTSESDLDVDRILAARKAARAKRSINRNYSDIAEGEEEETASMKIALQEVPVFTKKPRRARRLSACSQSEGRLDEVVADLRRIQSSPDLGSNEYEQSPHILLPGGDFLV